MSDAVQRGDDPTRGARQGLWIICIAVALTQASWGLIIPVLPVYARQFNASSADLGFVVAAFSLARIIINVPAGMLADRMLRRALLSGAITAVALVQAATALASSLAYLLVMRALLGLAAGVAITVSQTIMADLTESRNRAHAMARLQAMQLGAAAFGPALGGVTAGLFGPRVSFVLAAALAMLVALVTALRLPAQHPQPGHDSASDQHPPQARTLLRDRSYIAVCIVVFTVFFARFGGQQTLIALIAYDRIDLSTTVYGTALSVAALVNLATVGPVARLSSRTRKIPIVSAMLLGGTIYGAFALVHDRWPFFVALAVLAMSNELSGPVPATYCADVLPANARGRGMGLYRTFGDTGGLLGPIVLGAAIDRWSLSFAAVITGVLMLATATVFGALARETMPRRRSYLQVISRIVRRSQ